MAPRDAVAWDFDAIMPALRDPDRRIPLLLEVEKWSSTHADTILEVAARGQIEKAWTQMTDALHQMARTQFLRTTSSVPAEIKDATVRRREALRHRKLCREALAETNDTDSLLALAWTTWIAVHKLKLATKNVRRLVQAEAASQRAQLCCELQEAWERRDHSLMWRLARKLGGKRNGPKKIFFNVPSSIRPSSSDWRRFLCGPRENGRCEGVEAEWPRSDQLELQRGPLATAPTNKLLHRITKELAKGKARRAVPPWSIPGEIWLMMLRPRDPDILETKHADCDRNRFEQQVASDDIF